MRGIDRLQAVERSTPTMAAVLPDLPMAETVIVRLVRIAAAGMGQYFEPVFRAMDLTENSFHVLCLLLASDAGCASPSELSELVGTSRANMTKILDDLITQGMVTREIERRDARRSLIQITAHGRNVATAAVPTLMAPLREAFDGLTPAEFLQFDLLLRKVIKSFDKTPVSLRRSA